ncbi:MAG: 4-hydroxythreonine-4-phosphate dehydrogenase PdxA [Candidatus Omnitrophica bacterium]|nr:4-hydroxythreonine-4-phosphate dehydrogenase PdxA [Candidatus Omnitrophota bacterium]
MGRKRLICAITLGDPAGVGPEITLKALADTRIRGRARFIVIGNYLALEKAASLGGIKLSDIKRIKGEEELKSGFDGPLVFLEAGKLKRLEFGRMRRAYAKAALESINVALRLMDAKKADALVTAPVNKHAISSLGKRFSGHTEYLAEYSGTKDFAMMLAGGPLKVVVVTRHIALKQVSRLLTIEKVYKTISLTACAMKKYFALRSPTIAVCGLNPHSGEGGVIGSEEQDIIGPAIKKAKGLAQIVGPLAADTLFYSAAHGRFDAVVAMYHDQGLIPLKMLALHKGVNITLGLPFVRTSPDHGTAYDIAGKNKANPGSMKAAINLAVQIGLRSQSRGLIS